MPRKQLVPSYRRQRMPRGNPDRAFVELGGRRAYLGDYGCESSREAYRRAVGEWMAGNTKPADEGPTIVEMTVAFMDHAESYYQRPGGRRTCEMECFKSATTILNRMYATTSAAAFGPRGLRTVRDAMVKTGWSRGYVNRQANRIRRMFKWAASVEMVPATVFHALQTVDGLRRGRGDARETEPVQPVTDAIVEQTTPHLTPTLAGMVRVHRLIGCRPGEICVMRKCDVDTTGKVWTYAMADHKTAYHGHVRVIHIGPRAQDVLRPFLMRAEPTAFVFAPAESERERREAVHAARTTPMSCGNKPGSIRVRNPKREAGDKWTAQTYGRAIAYACERAGVPHWSPNQLRHTFASEIRKLHGLEAAQVLLGHARADVTQIYAERDHAKAREVAALVG
ncbi:MAG: site-specific integrase [Phycisphaerales bacterium]|nr:site-specific integrase [Phycisphaerales bacterium]